MRDDGNCYDKALSENLDQKFVLHRRSMNTTDFILILRSISIDIVSALEYEEKKSKLFEKILKLLKTEEEIH